MASDQPKEVGPGSTARLRSYFLNICLGLFGDDDEANVSQLKKKLSSFEESMAKFATDPGEISLTVTREEDDNGDVRYGVRLGVDYNQNDNFSSVVFIKRVPAVEESKSISSQFRVMNLTEDYPLESMHSLLKDMVTPFFNSYAKKFRREGDKLVPSVQKKISELEVSLLHLQQNIDIPDIQLTIHPAISGVVQKAVEGNRKPRVEDFGNQVSDSTFLNQLQKDVSRWIKEIKKVTQLDREPSSGTALQEISFWLNLEHALSKIQAKRSGAEIQLTLDVLKAGKRFLATVSFDSDTGLKEAVEKVKDYGPLMKEFPLNDLLAAGDLVAIKTSVAIIFNHLKKIRNTAYPVHRAICLVEAISRDLNTQMLKILSTHKLMIMPYEEFDDVMNQCQEVFTTWDDDYDRFQGQLREINKKKRDEMKVTFRATHVHKKLQERLHALRQFRRQHEQLQAVIIRVLHLPTAPLQSPMPGADKVFAVEIATAVYTEEGAVHEVHKAYDTMKVVDCLDLTLEGTGAWNTALKRYDDRIDKVETAIAARLRDQLGTAKSANEMFNIFSRYNALFVRPHIRGAIKEYQSQLIQKVKDDIEGLHQKFKVQYAKSSAYQMSTALDIPPVSGSIIWARQIERKLVTYLKRVEDVLGPDWDKQTEGQKLKEEGEAFKKKLNTQDVFEDWKLKVEARPHQVIGKIFSIVTHRTRTGSILKLEVNFPQEVVQLSKEVRNLRWLGFRVPLVLVNRAAQANQLHPHAVCLIESVRTYQITCEKIYDNQTIAPLIAGLKKECQTHLQEGIQLTWDSFKLEQYARKLADCVFAFQEKTDELLNYTTEIIDLLEKLETCEYSYKIFKGILDSIQKVIDDLNLHAFTNLTKWVRELDEKVEQVLVVRVSAGLKEWTRCLLGMADETADNTDAPSGPKPGGDPMLQAMRLELKITNQVIRVEPPTQSARVNLVHQLHSWMSIVTNLPRILSSRYQVGLEELGTQELSYRSLTAKLMKDNSEPLIRAYGAIEETLNEVSHYVKEWLQYQSLWDMEMVNITSRLEEDLSKWEKLLIDIKHSRKTFDTTETRRSFGPVEVDYRTVQQKITDKYDSWHKQILGKFGNMLAGSQEDFYSTVSKNRTELENHSVDSSSTSEVVAFITLLQGLKRKLKDWKGKVEVFRGGHKILKTQRYQFPPKWLELEMIEGEWGAFNEILKRKDAAIQSQVAPLSHKIVQESKLVEQKTTDLLNDWEKGRPVQGDLTPENAKSTLSLYEGKFLRLKEDRENISKAKEALELETGSSGINEEKLAIAIEELHDLRSAWAELAKIWEQIYELKEKPWISIVPRKIRQSLDSLIQQLKNLPTKLRQYAAYDHLQRVLKVYTKVNMMVTDLKSEALKDRHWKELRKRLRLNVVMAELTLGHIWDADLQRNEATVKDVILVAQGEMALEEFLKQVKEFWEGFNLDLVNYQNKCKLIRGWDDLFTKCREHMNSVAAMKLSPYYKVFEEAALTWEDKLNKINAVFDVWIDVQRRWVYLEGIFTGSADIKHLLPIESQRFSGISSEFITLMKKVTKSALVMDVINIAGVQKTLDRLADLLGKIQKALGEYLERERASFPRFYFVGDEDLLEIIGNSKSVEKLQKHFKKMFAGIAAVQLSEDQNTIFGIASREGEEVKFVTPISILDHPKINEWLGLVEKQMRITLAAALAQAVEDVKAFHTININISAFMEWVDKYQAQLVVLSVQISWSNMVDNALQTISGNSSSDMTPLQDVLGIVEATLNVLADSVLQEQPPIRRKKLEHLITELVHQRDMTRLLVNNKITSPKSFEWLAQMRFYFNSKVPDVLQQLSIHMANAQFTYSFEYLGVQDKLVQTPLTDRCYLTMTQALEERLGGSPFGPAGTGKTESVKALGHQMGRFVLVFNCDETFDFQAMGRIFVGLCQVGAWGCFDEFNRLEERMLSAVSQQIQTIQEALKEHGRDKEGQKGIVVELIGKQVRVNPAMAIFITMNPGYAGRSNLPDNLKQLFRSLAMTKPDRQLIAQVMLYSQGFRTAEKLASKIVPFFKLCDEQLSYQSHYDFGLRALKSVLVSSGNVKRDRILAIKEQQASQQKSDINEAAIAEQLPEQEILIQSVCETVVPKLVAEDIPLLYSLLSDVFPGVKYTTAEMKNLRREIAAVCEECHLVYGDDETGGAWVQKVLQLYQIIQLHHGLMMVGPSGSGKSTAWRVLLMALERLEGVEGVAHVIDPKAISKEDLYGVLDPNTREWTDGLFTHILRKIIDNVRGEINKRQWIIFDGDVDPEWVENLNSVLDDNKLLTLPNGERLSLPPNVRIMFEVEDLRSATLATVSRCGMVWFSEEVLTFDMICENFLTRLRKIPMDEGEGLTMGTPLSTSSKTARQSSSETALSPTLQVQNDCVNLLLPFFATNGLVDKALQYAEQHMEHVMDFTRLRALGSLFSMVCQIVRNVLNYNQMHLDFPMKNDQLEQYVPRALVYALLWSFGGDARLKLRENLGEFIKGITTIPLPSTTAMPVIDYEVTMTGEWSPWASRVPKIEVETHKVGNPDVVVPTLDTVRHESLLNTWLADHKPLVLCGPPGSGKTMTLFSALRALPDFEVVGLNFSSATSPELLLKTFDHYCEYRRTPNGVIMSPIQLGKWLVLFCDEINLPDLDKYGTQRVISFLRQLVEHGGFYRTADQTWIKMERIQFVGACNPPTDPGRKPLTHRFLRHVPVIYVDYPGPHSLNQIYGTFNRAMLRLVPNLRAYSDPLTEAMVEFYTKSQDRFTQDMQPHYIYSPREMTRWVRGIYEALKPVESLPVEGLVRIWTHEGLRLFQDRLVNDEERMWTDENINAVAVKYFPNIDTHKALQRPILYSNWLSKDYVPVDREDLREYVQARLKVFYEEELDVPLVLFNEVFDHVLRIDRILRQSQGHLLLIGVSGAGKTTLTRFVAWINGLTIFQIKVHNKYTAVDFDDDLRNVLRRAGCKSEKIVFIMDESNVLESGFLERMNILLANGEVPGLFEGDEYSTLMTQCKEGSQRDGLMLDSSEELYKWFTQQIMKNLHVVFTMNPSSEGLKDRAATSPALFNRCVLNWFGDWSTGALYQVGQEFTQKLDVEKPDYIAPSHLPRVYLDLPVNPTHRQVLNNAFVFVHLTLHQANAKLAKRGGHTMTITPRHYLDFINHYVKLFNEKRADLEEQQLHLNVGLNKIRETVDQVEELQASLSVKKIELEQKNQLANQKLKQMVADQQEAEKRKGTSQEIQENLQIQTKKIGEKKEVVLGDLAKVEPAVRDAQQAVKAIKREHLVEIRALRNPPKQVKTALESVCLLLGEPSTDWKEIRSIIMKDNFISDIVKFSTEDINDVARDKMKKEYLSDPNYTFEKMNHASKACGPLVQWAIAQVGYADVLKRVDPLRAELKVLENQAEETKLKGEEIDKIIKELEESIARYKDEYAILIDEANRIKSNLQHVETKVERSKALLASLATEKVRWEEGTETFKSQMSTIVGDVLLTSAFMAYGGYFDQQFRQILFTKWASHLQQASIQFRADLARVEYLSNADERLKWQANALPTDDLCSENAIMIKRFNRYPLIIDPSGQATEFIMNEFKDRKISKTSFLDDAFRKNLESALRFGNPLLVQDVENYDPILNPVLNREVRRTGGRVLITLGDQDIDLSPSFTIILSTRDPTVEFPPDLCSRVTFVNFTVTRSSLQSQCLNEVLKSERPDVDKKRSDLLKLQGEFLLRLRHLEKSLLQALNEVKGKILDDDRIITQLENLKKEAAEVAKKMEETDTVMAEVDRVSQEYMPLSTSCSSIYFTLEGLNQIHFLYQYSLQFFLDIFQSVLCKNKALTNVTDYKKRLEIITHSLFKLLYNRVAHGMLHEDRIILAILLCIIHLKGTSSEAGYNDLYDYFLRGKESLRIDQKVQKVSGLNREQALAMEHLAKNNAYFSQLENYVAGNTEFLDWLNEVTPEKNIPECWNTEKQPSDVVKAFLQLLVVQTFRPDRLLAMGHIFVATIMGEDFQQEAEQDPNLSVVVEEEIKPNTPVLLCSVAGFDASHRVDDLASAMGKPCTPIALGSAEGFSLAEKAISSASRNGRWVLLKNVHLAPQWLMQLEKKLHSLQAHPNFRLFLTMEINPKVPVNLLRCSRIFTFEPPPGVKASLSRTFGTVPAARMAKEPTERARLYFLLAWFNALVQERLRYAPLGWAKKYEFNESDLRMACDTLDTWLELIAQGRSNLPPDKVPWTALKTLLSQCIYGGRIDNDFDQRLLNSFVNRLFTASSFEADFPLIKMIDEGDVGAKKITMPDGIRRGDYIRWVEQLPDSQTPSWLGLPNNAEKVLLTKRGTEVVTKLLKMQMLSDDDEFEYSATTKIDSKEEKGDGRPAWMKTLNTTSTEWLSLLPTSVTSLKRADTDSVKDPLFRFFEREVNTGVKLLRDVRNDLEDVKLVCEAKKKQTNYLRSIISDLAKGIIPKSWNRYTVPVSLTVIQWVMDFSERIKQLQTVSDQVKASGIAALKTVHIWLGGLFTPEAYITATRQCVAQANQWPLEELYLEMIVDVQSLDACTFGVTGMQLQGADCRSNILSLTNTILTGLPTCGLKWIRLDPLQHQEMAKGKVTLPVYLNHTRAELLFTVDFAAQDVSLSKEEHSYYERGVAMFSSAL